VGKDMDGNGNRASRRTHLLLLEPIQLLGTLWQRVLGEDPDFELVEAFSDPSQALGELGSFDVAVTGPSLSQEQALAFTREAVLSHPGVRVVVTGIPRTEAAVVQAAEAGAAGLVLREQPIEEALSAIRAACSGEAHIAPGVAPMLMNRLAELTVSLSDADTVGRRYLELTPREREVLDLIAHGLTNQQIAERLVVEVGTVKNHVHSILEKLDKRSREEAAGYLRSLPPGLA
jgi:DNA-binding NarL/FixJ family response regulator